MPLMTVEPTPTERQVPEIRRASAADAPNLAHMHVESWRETYPGLLPPAMLSSLSVDSRTAAWSRALSEPSQPTVVFVAELGGRIVGFGSCGPQRSEALQARGYDGEIEAVYVLQAFQQHGLGTRLFTAMACSMQARGLKGMSLWVLRDNMPAQAFYARLGGQVIAQREDARQHGVLFEVAYGWPDLAAAILNSGTQAE